MSRRALPGPFIDIITEGVDLSGGRSAVVKGLRRVMLSAHRAEWTFDDLYPLLTDESGRRLAKQIATGKGGRRISRRTRDEFLRKQWDETAAVVASRAAWDRDTALAAIEHVREEFEHATDLSDRDRAVVAAVIDLAGEYGTTRVAAPVREVGRRAGITKSAANRALMRLSADGVWLGLAQRGNPRTGRSSLYLLAPHLLNVWGASPPRSHPIPMSHPPMSHDSNDSQREDDMSVALTASSPEALAAAIRLLASEDPDAARRVIEQVEVGRPRLRVVGEDS